MCHRLQVGPRPTSALPAAALHPVTLAAMVSLVARATGAMIALMFLPSPSNAFFASPMRPPPVSRDIREAGSKTRATSATARPVCSSRPASRRHGTFRRGALPAGWRGPRTSVVLEVRAAEKSYILTSGLSWPVDTPQKYMQIWIEILRGSVNQTCVDVSMLAFDACMMFICSCKMHTSIDNTVILAVSDPANSQRRCFIRDTCTYTHVLVSSMTRLFVQAV